jgi:hypothetical protein
MNTFFKTFAVLAILWAIFTVTILPALVAAHGVGPMSRSAHHMARDLRTAVPEQPTNDVPLVTLPAQRVFNAAQLLDWAGDASQDVLSLQAFHSVISSVIIIILSICTLRACRKIQTLPPNNSLQPTATVPPVLTRQ